MGTLMKEKIELLIDRATNWPEAAQAQLGRLIDELEQKHVTAYQLADEEHADLQASLEEIAAGEVATEEEAATLFNRYRR
jgi:hypothetical protein